MSKAPRMVIGCMTGTSLDGLDAALVRVDGCGLALQIEVVDFISFAFPSELREELSACAGQAKRSAGEFARLSRAFGEFHAQLLQQQWGGSAAAVALVSVHGQTVFHQPPDSWQLINVHPIARALDCAVVFDLRAADLAAGGAGAPLTPLVDALLFASTEQARWILNFGGIVNYTQLRKVTGAGPGAEFAGIEAGDLCICNQLLDRAAERLLGQPFDRGGAAALGGTVQHEAATELLFLLRVQSQSRRSLGTGDECAGWLEHWAGRLVPADLLRTICWSISEVIATTLAGATTVLGAGGGLKNKALELELAACGITVLPLAHECGMNAANREAVAWAVLGILCQDGVPISLPSVTGLAVQPAPLAGTWVYSPWAKELS